jgi:hypothetical protein
LRKPSTKRVSPIHRRFSVPMSRSTMSPSAWEMNDHRRVREGSIRTEHRSRARELPVTCVSPCNVHRHGRRRELTFDKVQACQGNIESVFGTKQVDTDRTCRAYCSVLPIGIASGMNIPVGIGAIGMRRAFLASGRFASPLMTSYSVPSPPTAAMTLQSQSYNHSLFLGGPAHS